MIRVQRRLDPRRRKRTNAKARPARSIDPKHHHFLDHRGDPARSESPSPPHRPGPCTCAIEFKSEETTDYPLGPPQQFDSIDSARRPFLGTPHTQSPRSIDCQGEAAGFPSRPLGLTLSIACGARKAVDSPLSPLSRTFICVCGGYRDDFLAPSFLLLLVTLGRRRMRPQWEHSPDSHTLAHAQLKSN